MSIFRQAFSAFVNGRHLASAGWLVALAGCASARPSWTTRPPQGYTHEFYTGSGTGPGRAEARNSAISSAVARLAESGKLEVQVTRTDSSLTAERFRTGASPTLDRIDRTAQEIITTGTSPTISGLRLAEEFHQQINGRNEAWVLMKVPKSSGVRPAPTRTSFVMRAVALPGWGQYAMGRQRQGLFLGLGAAASIPAATAFASMRAENLTRARSTQIQAARTSFTNLANRYGTLSAVTVAGTLGLWTYGVIDAAAGPVRLYVSNTQATTKVGLELALW
jgi:hypothetical protein